MAEKNGSSLKQESEPSFSIDYPVVRKKFRVTVDVEATLAAGPRGGAQPPAPEDQLHTRILMERLMSQPHLVDRLLRYRVAEAVRHAGKVLEVEYARGEGSERGLLGQLFAELEPDTRAYFTEELEDGASAYYFDGYGATVERTSVTEIDGKRESVAYLRS